MGVQNWIAKVQTGLLLIILCLGSTFPSYASGLKEYLYETWTSRDGLPHNSINAITQTTDGYLWFATWEGIARFNGHDFKHYTRGPNSGLIDSGIRTLYSDPQGGLLAGGVRGGLAYRTQHNWQALKPIKNLVNAVLRQPDGSIWIGLQSEGLYYRAPNATSDRLILPSLSVYKLSMSHDGKVLAATSKGLFVVTKDTTTNISTTTSLGENPIYDAVTDQQGKIIFGGKDGAWMYAEGKATSIHSALDDLFVTRVLIDDQGNYWFGTINKGVYRLSGEQLTVFDERAGLSHNRVLSLYQDRERSIWIGTNGGLTRLHKAPFTIWDKQRGLAGDYARTVLALESGEILAGTSRGLSVIAGTEIKNFKNTDENSKPLSILSLAPNKEGGVWVGTYSQGMFQYRDNSLSAKSLPYLPTNEIRAILEDAQGQLWVGTSAGLVKYTANGEHQLFTTTDGLPDNYIMALAQDKFGRIWVGSGVGVATIENDKVTRIDIDAMDQAQYVFGFYGQDDYMWLTTDRGLIRYRFADNSLSFVGRRHGLPIDKLFQVVSDQTGYFWLTSNRGIWRIAIDQAHAIADGMESQVRFEHYNERDGMRTAQVNGGSSPAATVDSSGTLWFPTAKGVASTNPQYYSDSVITTFPTAIEQVKVDQSVLELGNSQPFELAAGSQRISFDYVGLGYLSSQHIRYQTKLEGLENQWVTRGSQTTADYTNLSPGHYTFVVKAYYQHHESDVNQASVSFVILPHWWQRKSIQLLFSLMLVASIALSFWWRLRLLQRSEIRLKSEVMQKTLALQKQAAAFEVQAREDQLTGLKNRRAFDEWIENVVYTSGDAKAFSLALVDIDHFKSINDTYTHLIGDKVLQTVVENINKITPDNCFVARWGGEEFVIGFINWTAEDVYDLCEALRLEVKAHDYSSVAQNLSVTVSTGLVNADNKQDFEQLLRNADRALLHVKSNGRDGICVYDNDLLQPPSIAIQ
ncbi:putative periplasmic ligand-binding sensor protein [Vibrio sinaloensis DSM 21326]|uniref:diguanylate cyclase n=1 Tax=Vibrio sinaloensis DSM 21326 TaxID=945550 RepID=E8M5C2_PHOS4|nr:ligand-binding sensor domain-containing diguanylate cyclase [Vibrio sinaloensis]EGA70715.1 putative periplasmic ligand-binding sensor protein [Vibrio sinaloensis DSM 21326]